MIAVSIEKLKQYEDLEKQGNLLKNPKELENSILERMKEFMDEYRGYSESSIDHFGGKSRCNGNCYADCKKSIFRSYARR